MLRFCILIYDNLIFDYQIKYLTNEFIVGENYLAVGEKRKDRLAQKSELLISLWSA